MAKSSSHFIPKLLLIIVAMLCFQALAAPRNTPIPDGIISAKSIYIVNETGNQAVLDAANDQFTKWGRFTIVQSKNDADLVVVFAHKNGMDKWGNLGLIEMDVFPKDSNKSAFQVKKGFRTIFEPQQRTNACISEFEKSLEQKH